MFVAPQTISSGSPSPTVTRVSERRSARGWRSTDSSSPTTTLRQSSPHRSIPLTSMPRSVSRSASRSGVRSTSTNSRSHDRGTLMCAHSSELLEETEVVLEEQPDIGDAVLEHLDPLGTHAEGESLVALRIEPPVAENDGVDHPCPEDRHPARSPARRATGSSTDQALHVERDRRLGERVVARPEARSLVRAVHRLGELVE